MSKWNSRFMDMATLVASWSKDTNTKVGAVVIDKDKIVLSMGYNGFPRGVDDSIEYRFEKPAKYLFTEHAERNAIYHAARHGVSLRGCSMYATMFPCADCARAMIQAGITKVIAPTPDVEHEKWGEMFKVAITMFEEAKVEMVLLNEEIQKVLVGIPNEGDSEMNVEDVKKWEPTDITYSNKKVFFKTNGTFHSMGVRDFVTIFSNNY